MIKLIGEKIIHDVGSNTIYEIECDDDTYWVNSNNLKGDGDISYKVKDDTLYCIETNDESRLNPIRKLTIEEMTPYLHLII
jgi:hypothetical protein